MRKSPSFRGSILAMVIAASWSSPSLDGAEPVAEKAQAREIRAPEADRVDKGQAEASKTTMIDVFHKQECKCRTYEEGGICLERSHWALGASGAEYNPDSIASFIKSEADLEREKEKPRMSERACSIRADRAAPWKYVVKIFEGCAVAGIYKVDAVALSRGSKGPPGRIRMWLPTDADVTALPPPPFFRPGATAKERPVETVELRIVLRFDRDAADASKAVRREVDGKVVPADEELRDVVRRHVADHPRAGGADGRVIIDADPQVPWSEVVNVFVLCRMEKIEKPTFAAPRD